MQSLNERNNPSFVESAFFKSSDMNSVVILSASGNTGILVIAISVLYPSRNRGTIDNGLGKNQKSIS